MSLTFTRLDNGDLIANGENLRYLIDQAIPGTRPQSTRWRVRVFVKVVTEFKSDNSELITSGDVVQVAFDRRLRDVTAWAEAFETSEIPNPLDYGRRAADAIDRSYRALGYTR